MIEILTKEGGQKRCTPQGVPTLKNKQIQKQKPNKPLQVNLLNLPAQLQ